MITAATGISPYYIGKPNPLMMRTALNRIGAHSETSVMIGDRMDTDVKSGLEAGMRSILVLSGSTGAEDISTYPFRPTLVREIGRASCRERVQTSVDDALGDAT